MGTMYDELKRKSELICPDILELYSEIVDAYHKGEIDCCEYMELYEIIEVSGRSVNNLLRANAG